MKTIRIYAEVKENWIDAQRADDLGAWIRASQEMVTDKAIAKIVDKIVEKTKLPKIEVSKKELKEAVLDKMAERVLDKEDE